LSEGPQEPVRIGAGATVQMAFACENISTDPVGRLSFQNVIDQLNATQFPAGTPSFFAVFGFISTTAQHLVQCRVEVMPQRGSQPIAAQQLQDIPFTPDRPGHRSICGFPGIAWPEPGEYVVRFTTRGQTIASFPIRVVQVQLPTPPAR